MTAPTVDLDTLHLAHGSHTSFEDGACLLEATAYIAGEPFSDAPACVSPFLTSYGIRLNDALPDGDRQQLKQYISRLIGTRGDGKDDARRTIAADWAVRTALPRWLDAAGLTGRAAALRALPPFTSPRDVDRHYDVIDAARQEAWTARQAARDRVEAAVRAELAKRGGASNSAAAAAADVAVAAAADAAAAAAAAADVAAAAAADVAVAVAADVAVAAAAAAAADVAVAKYSPQWYRMYDAIRAELRKTDWAAQVRARYADVVATNNREAIELLERLIDAEPTA